MATKSSAKKASKKSAKKSAKKTGASFPLPNLACIEACIVRYERCIAKGVERAICMKRLQKNLANCLRGIFPKDE